VRMSPARCWVDVREWEIEMVILLRQGSRAYSRRRMRTSEERTPSKGSDLFAVSIQSNRSVDYRHLVKDSR
jgi:hypothetical protein